MLASFQVQQSGEELRIVDADGSVYSGTLRLAAPTRRAPTAKPEASAAPRASRASQALLADKTVDRLDSDRLGPQTYTFRVAGTNLSLSKKVVFTGSLLATNLNTVGGLGGGQNAPAQLGVPSLLNTRITGKVVVGTSKPVEINALPASP